MKISQAAILFVSCAGFKQTTAFQSGASTFGSRKASPFLKSDKVEDFNTPLQLNQLNQFPSNAASTTTVLHSGNPFTSLFFGDEPKKEVVPAIPDAVIDPDYKLTIGTAALAALIVTVSPAIIAGTLGTFIVLLAILFGVQSTRVRFVFDETAFEVKAGSQFSDELKSSGENFVVGGENRWTYDSFVNWDFFPNAEFPILVYFKETQTPSDKWDEGPGQLDKVGGGQIHFFPAIGNVNQLQEQFELRGCARIVE